MSWNELKQRLVNSKYYYFHTNNGVLLCGDCLKIMKNFPEKSIDLTLTDPPYGIKRDKGFHGCEGFKGKGMPIKRREYCDDWDYKPKKEVFDLIIRISKQVMIFGGNFFTEYLPQSNHWLFWDKLNTMPSFSDGELIWTNIKRNSVKKITRQYNGLIGKEKERYHPMQKPVDLITKLVKLYSSINDIILDPFLGSGTTAVACEKLNRRWIGIEKEEKYCKISKNRILKEGRQKNLFYFGGKNEIFK